MYESSKLIYALVQYDVIDVVPQFNDMIILIDN